ncbi:9024_t:CDS:2, partial [Funneliformis geosporum]
DSDKEIESDLEITNISNLENDVSDFENNYSICNFLENLLK